MQGIQRIDVLLSRFSEDEIVRLSKLQVHYREQPPTFDQPLEERRLQFARWLVEHGRLSENTELGTDERPAEETEEPRYPEYPNNGSKWVSRASPRPLDGEPTPDNAYREPPKGGYAGYWHVALFHPVSWLRQGIRTVAPTDRHGASSRPRPRGIIPPNSYGSVAWYFEAPWLWMGF
jgi:hypothetical protein